MTFVPTDPPGHRKSRDLLLVYWFIGRLLRMHPQKLSSTVTPGAAWAWGLGCLRLVPGFRGLARSHTHARVRMGRRNETEEERAERKAALKAAKAAKRDERQVGKREHRAFK